MNKQKRKRCGLEMPYPMWDEIGDIVERVRGVRTRTPFILEAIREKIDKEKQNLNTVLSGSTPPSDSNHCR